MPPLQDPLPDVAQSQAIYDYLAQQGPALTHAVYEAVAPACSRYVFTQQLHAMRRQGMLLCNVITEMYVWAAKPAFDMADYARERPSEPDFVATYTPTPWAQQGV